MASSNARIAKNTIFLYFRLIIVVLISLFTVRVIMQELGEEGFGTFNVVAGFVTLVGFIGTTMTTGIQRFFNFEIGSRGEKAANEVYSAAIKIQVVAALIAILIFETIGLWYVNSVMNLPEKRMTEINFLYQFAILSLVLNILTVPFNAFVIAKEHMNSYAVISVVESVLKLVIACALSLFSDNRLAIYGFLLLVIAFFNFLAYYIYCRHLFPWLKYTQESDLIKPILTFSGWNSLSSVANIGKGQGVNLLLNYFFGVGVNAANAVVTQIYSAVQMFSINICTAFRPQLVESYAKRDFKRSLSMVYIMTKSAYAMVYMLCIPIYLELSFILELWLGNNIPLYTIDFTVITLLIILVGSLNTPVSMIIYANGNIKWYTIVYSGIVLCIPIGWLAFTAGAQPTNIFWITLMLMIIIQFLSLIIMKKHITYSYKEYLSKVIFPIVLFSLFTPIVPYLVKQCGITNNFIELLTVCICTLISCSITAFGILLSSEQKKILITKLKKSRFRI